MAVIASDVLANGLRTEFADTYAGVKNRVADSRLAMVMDLSMTATNAKHEFAYFNAAPHMAHWPRGTTIAQKDFDSVQFSTPVFDWGRRIGWHKNDRKDDQTQSLMDVARMAGESAALTPLRMFFDLLQNGTTLMPAVPNAPDGAAFFADSRFGTSEGNLITGGGVATTAAIQGDYYTAIETFKSFQDGQAQPLLSDDAIDSGVVIIHPAAATEAFEQAFIQQRQGVLGPDNTTDAVTSVQVSNVVQDASRNVTLWGSNRLTDANDWYIFLKGAPKLPTFLLTREGITEYQCLDTDNNSDRVRDRGEEYVQFEERSGAGIALPFGAIKLSNA